MDFSQTSGEFSRFNCKSFEQRFNIWTEARCLSSVFKMLPLRFILFNWHIYPLNIDSLIHGKYCSNCRASKRGQINFFQSAY